MSSSKQCANPSCGESFIPRKVGGEPQTYCSSNCRKAGNHAANAAAGKCQECLAPLPHPTGRGRPFKRCEPCRVRRNANKVAAYKRDPHSPRDYHLKHQYGIDLKTYEEMLKRQGGVCALCGEPETATDHRSGKVRALAVDHDHNTGKVRALLCATCNLLLPEQLTSTQLRKMAEYLEAHS